MPRDEPQLPERVLRKIMTALVCQDWTETQNQTLTQMDSVRSESGILRAMHEPYLKPNRIKKAMLVWPAPFSQQSLSC